MLTLLSECPRLQKVLIWSNPFHFNLSLLAPCSNLRSLTCCGAWVADLGPLASLPKFEELVCENSQPLTDVSALTACKRLRIIDIRGSGVQDLNPLASCTSLEILDCSGTNIQDLDPLASCASLKSFSFRETFIKDLSDLSACRELIYLDCRITSVRDLKPLIACCNQLEMLKFDYFEGVEDQLESLYETCQNHTVPDQW